MIWHFEKNGLYSVKSGYMVAQKRLPTSIASSSSGSLSEWWKALWKLNVPSKIRMFIWRLCFDRLPTRSNLVKRGVDVQNCCVHCGRKGEDCFHVFWGCKHAIKMWFQSKFARLLSIVFNQDPLHVLMDWKEKTELADFEELIVFLWGLWNRRNAKVFKSQETISKFSLADWAFSYLDSYRTTNAKLEPRNRPQFPIRWMPPEEGFYKINTDASVSMVDLNAGLGIIIRDHQGQVLAAETKYLEFVSSIDVAEALAASEGLKLARDAGIRPVQLEVDSMRVFHLFRQEKEDISELGEIVAVAKRNFPHFSSGLVSFMKRDGNGVADCLARRALVQRESQIWLESWPAEISSMLAVECLDFFY